MLTPRYVARAVSRWESLDSDSTQLLPGDRLDAAVGLKGDAR